ncbi:hypothetical protein BJY04DRAFT_223827 [Aspergillus karnatakaensis]|uniref:uncharacterized protein n=1 Tax=Aspergillus karnatakaensis TaxID=1810916 RepID=UPI003CCD0EA7
MSKSKIEHWLGKLEPLGASGIKTENHEIYMAQTKEESRFGYRWMILLVSANGEHYTAYYSERETGNSKLHVESYTRKRLQDQDFAKSKSIFKKEYWIGNIPAKSVSVFGDTFFKLQPGPDQFFAVRFIYELGRKGLIDERILLHFLREAEYGPLDESLAGRGFYPPDQAFLEELMREGLGVEERGSR